MTTAIIVAALAATFAIGFLVGDRRAVGKCNVILDGHCNMLLKAMLEEKPQPGPLAGEEQPAWQTVH